MFFKSIETPPPHDQVLVQSQPILSLPLTTTISIPLLAASPKVNAFQFSLRSYYRNG